MNDDELDPMEVEMARLIDVGALELEGMTEDGEPLFKVNLEILKVEAPELYKLHMAEVEEGLLELFEMGFVDISYNEKLEATFTITEAGKQAVEQMKNDGPIGKWWAV